jgi:Fic family protein
MYIHQRKEWPGFIWDYRTLQVLLGKVRNLQGRLLGRMEAIGFSLKEEALLETLTVDVVKSNEIEGSYLDANQVRSSLARRLGIDVPGLIASDRNVEGVVEMMLDATQNFDQDLTEDRLFGWHSALFPTGRSGMKKIKVGEWRDDTEGPMQVVSGPMGKERIHYEAPKSELIDKEMRQFLNWFNEDSGFGERNELLEPVLKSGIAHFWFVTIHPFDDGNGRIARAIADMQLCKADGTQQRFYSMSAQIERQKEEYYDILETTQKGSLDITGWLKWYLSCMQNALESSELLLSKVLGKAKFWKIHASTIINERQKEMINKLLDDFYGKLTTTKWAKMTKCSQDTALRDIQDLIGKNILIKESAGGRSTSYILNSIN